MKDEPEALQAEFLAAAPAPAMIEPPKVMITFPVDADVLAFFQSDTEPGDWQRHMNGVLRYYVDTNQATEAAFEAEAEAATRAGQEQAGPRTAAEQALLERHWDEYEEVHNGSGRSEEMPSELEARHRQDWEAFERQWPQTPPAPPKPA